jgi:hypothetical protein
VAMEVRYIIFSPDEVRSAIISFVQKQGQAASSNDVTSVEVVGPSEAPTAMVRLQGSPAAKPIKLSEQYLVAALLLYCTDRRIPIPKQAAKRVELSVNGLTLAMTSDRTQGSPNVANHQVSYGEIANRATQRIGTVQEELARAIARADYAETLAVQAEDRARKAEAARGRSSALLTAVALVPGLRGHVGRWLVKFKFPYSVEGV